MKNGTKNKEQAPLTFGAFQLTNAARCQTCFHPVKEWTPQDWALAIAGEAGELCNLLKKVKRGDFTIEQARGKVLREAADVITYADLLMTALGADTGEEVLRKFNEVSKRVDYPEVSA